MTRRPAGLLCAGWLALIVLACALADWVAPYDPQEQDLGAVYSGPTGRHWLGTDQLGRDILSRILHGGQVSLPVVAEALAVYVVLGVLFGLAAGYRPGLADRMILRVCDLLLSVPAVVILLAVLAIFSHNESAAMLTLGFLASGGLVRVVRAGARDVRDEPFVTAARAAGLTTPQILRRHVLPRIAGPVISLTSLVAGSALLVETSLGYLGLGVQPPRPSWGGLIAEASQAIFRQTWMLVPTGGVIVLTALALGVLGDVVRDAASDRTTAGALSWRRMRTRVTAPDQEKGVDEEDGDDVLLSVRDLSVRLEGPGGPTRIVDEVSFHVRRGEAVGLVGESGCGKTMAVSALLRLLPAGGTVSAAALRFDGRDLLAMSEREIARIRGRSIAYIAQEPVAGLDPLFTVGAQVAEAVRHHTGLDRRAARARAAELLEMVRLPRPATVMTRYPHELSGGMAQRVSIARALAGEPALLIADEPTTALDVTVQAEILDLLRELRERTGMGLVLVTHDWGVVADACDRAVVMYAGQVVEQTGVDRVFTAPRHPYTEALLAADPSAGTPGRRLPVLAGSVPAAGRWPDGCRFAPRCGFAAGDCTAAPVKLAADGDGTAHRCLHPRHTTTAGG
ncbi:dipeptide/oligopeptide/nickel ABC transporter permease/ATP-binding protein [Actinomadura rubrisoli]|uniref:Dipeptide/oligopeptide/nickel ABC transporter permease/ATP-binding protein n=1 Tax=Actinomadura rubrisoli TaxID=2530368 RepID=A0A4R5BKN6_9ACTN|nr:dipeptide/oligopeptide/nickel ABC transporter permease/ATP-binding protein [Actinomadura rubrisoli]TDD85923.1 dipeptide/oligopeptide/nickel ABC transporter permease/ATP-binding protein [Actinomadura rubrisoli]